jgi:hypothetical protein
VKQVQEIAMEQPLQMPNKLMISKWLIKLNKLINNRNKLMNQIGNPVKI